jgi:hypothetical protein
MRSYKLITQGGFNDKLGVTVVYPEPLPKRINVEVNAPIGHFL